MSKYAIVIPAGSGKLLSKKYKIYMRRPISSRMTDFY